MPEKILVIDDEEDMQIYLQTLLEKAGYKTDVAVNGDEAIQKIHNFQPDLITLDILMPKKSGLNFFKLLRGEEKTKNVPVVIVSGVTGYKDFFDDPSAIGPITFVDKPIEKDSFLAKIKDMLGN